MELRESEDFENQIYVKSGIAPLLRYELKRDRWQPGDCDRDGYGSLSTCGERRYGRTRAALEVLAEYSGNSISITTKSDLVKRDIPLLQRIAEHNTVWVNMTITTLDASLARLLEPRAPRPELRLGAVAALAEAGIPVGVNPNPIMPLITDQEQRLDELARAACEHGARYFGGGVLFLMPCSRKVFFPFVGKYFPHLLRRYQERYEKDPYLKGAYRENDPGQNCGDSGQIWF